ncbi:MAG: Trk system potassium transporter TrkA [Eubacteriales bacterium]|nr:Trk system potassium transporter TrkA [Eubacteriales bacterium]
MKVIVIGAGKVGFSLAQILSSEKHDVTVVEIDEERSEVLREKLDVKVITGNGASFPVLEDADTRGADLFLAVTQNDEFNILASVIAKSMDVKKTVARVRNPDYDFNISKKITREKFLGIDLIINPEKVAAKEISKLISVPELVNVEYFAQGKIQTIEFKPNEGFEYYDVPLKDLPIPERSVLIALLRDEEIIIPSGNDQIRRNDLVFALSRTKDIQDLTNFFNLKKKKINNVTLLGGERVSFYLARILEKKKINVKIIERDPVKCEELARNLDNVLIINGDVSDINLLKEEGVDKSDFIVSLTNDDKLNLLVTLFLKHLGVEKSITQIRRSDYLPLIEKIGVENIISPRSLTSTAILNFIKSDSIISLSLLAGDKAQMLEVTLNNRKCSILDKPLKDINFPCGVIVGAITRDDDILVPRGNDVLKFGDNIVLFMLPDCFEKIQKMLG